MGETMILGLRLLCGVSRNEFRKNFGRSVEEVYGPVLEKYSRMGLLKIEGDRIASDAYGEIIENVRSRLKGTGCKGARSLPESTGV